MTRQIEDRLPQFSVWKNQKNICSNHQLDCVLFSGPLLKWATKKNILLLSNKSCLVNRDPYVMVYSDDLYNWVVKIIPFLPSTNEGFFSWLRSLRLSFLSRSTHPLSSCTDRIEPSLPSVLAETHECQPGGEFNQEEASLVEVKTIWNPIVRSDTVEWFGNPAITSWGWWFILLFTRFCTSQVVWVDVSPFSVWGYFQVPAVLENFGGVSKASQDPECIISCWE